MGKWREVKTKPRTWKFTYTRFSKRKPRIPKVSRVVANQYAIKRNKDRYDLVLRGTRIPIRKNRKKRYR